MFLFEGNFGTILHTGDCRLTPECLQNLPEKYVGKKGKVPRCQLNYLFLDCTFGKFSRKLPSKHSAIRQVILVGLSSISTVLNDFQLRMLYHQSRIVHFVFVYRNFQNLKEAFILA